VLKRFCQYVGKVFEFSSLIFGVTEYRISPEIPLGNVLSSTLVMFILRLGSINGIESELRHNKKLKQFIGKKLPSADTIGRVLNGINTDELRKILYTINHKLKRNKVFKGKRSYFFVAVDGHEFFASFYRSCEQCSVRYLTINDKKVAEYYHRGVVCHLIGETLSIPLDIEMIQPGEGELTAVQRLLKRVIKNYSRFFDVIVGDALYFNAPFFKLCKDLGKDVIAVMKGEDRTLLKDAQGLFEKKVAGQWEQDGQTCFYWDDEGFGSDGLDFKVRVLHTEELEIKRHRKGNKWVKEEHVATWWWVTTLSKQQLPTKELWEAAHQRWDIENRNFNTLNMHWSLDHCFKHKPVAIVNFILMLFISFVLIQSFYFRNIKKVLRKTFALIALAKEFIRSLVETTWVKPWLSLPVSDPP